ncbi:MAG TPA: radical SAM protein, partial [Gammaproteobacteria bacterium]
MSGAAKKILYVRLPCWKIYPGGVVYVADYVHKQRPNVSQEILDLALVEKGQYKQALEERLL